MQIALFTLGSCPTLILMFWHKHDSMIPIGDEEFSRVHAISLLIIIAAMLSLFCSLQIFLKRTNSLNCYSLECHFSLGAFNIFSFCLVFSS